jgi:cell division protein FtsZ
MAHFELAPQGEGFARIKVIGVGGAGGNAVNNMIDDGLDDLAEFIVCNTDLQALGRNQAATRVQLGEQVTRGLGAGGNPDVGRKAALEDSQRIVELLQGADMVFIACGLGGGTGTGAAPVIAQAARDMGALTVAVSTMPFKFEGKKRRKRAEEGLEALGQEVDTLIKIPNQKLVEVVDHSVSVADAFRLADKVLLDAVRGITELIRTTGEINVDFADVKAIMRDAGPALMGTGWGEGEGRAIRAAQEAISSPLLEDIGVDGATGILLNITGGSDLKLHEVIEAAELIEAAAHEDVELIYGQVFDQHMTDQVKITVIATGFEPAGRAQDPVAQVQAEARRERPSQIGMPYRAQGSERPLNRVYNRRPDSGSDATRPSSAPRSPATQAMFTDAEIDIPTFIRKQTAD